MATKIRKQVYIEPGQEQLLKKMAKMTGMTEAEIFRRAIDLHFNESSLCKRDLETWKKEVSFIKKIMKKKKHLTSKKRSWKREDLYD